MRACYLIAVLHAVRNVRGGPISVASRHFLVRLGRALGLRKIAISTICTAARCDPPRRYDTTFSRIHPDSIYVIDDILCTARGSRGFSGPRVAKRGRLRFRHKCRRRGDLLGCSHGLSLTSRGPRSQTAGTDTIPAFSRSNARYGSDVAKSAEKQHGNGAAWGRPNYEENGPCGRSTCRAGPPDRL